MSQTIVRARAPLRISFAGGGTDVSPYCDEQGGAVLSATFNKYVHVALVPNDEERVGLHSLDYQTSVHYGLSDGLAYDGELDLIKACVQRLYPERVQGFDAFVHADAPPGSGAGASSAVVVAVLSALSEWLRLPLTEYELAEAAFEIERKDLAIDGGVRINMPPPLAASTSSSSVVAAGSLVVYGLTLPWYASWKSGSCWHTLAAHACPRVSSATRCADIVRGTNRRLRPWTN